MIPARTVAEYFLRLADPEFGDLITNLKLQKLVYYAQGFHLAIYDEPLFPEPINAWEHGPVVEELYRYYKSYGAQPIEADGNYDLDMLTNDHKELLDEVYTVFGQFSAWKLRNMTHSEAPWLNTSQNEIIWLDAMKEYFKTQVN